MPLPMIDTLSVSRKLTAAGFDLKQVDALVESLAHAMDDTVATKADVAELKANQAGIEASITVMQGDLTRLSETAATKAELNDVRIEFRQLGDQLRIQIAGLESKVEIEIAGLESRVQTEIAGLKVEMAQGFEEVNKRLTRNVFGIAVIVSAVIALLQLLL